MVPFSKVLVHRFCWTPKSLSIHWHRYDGEALAAPGFTAHALGIGRARFPDAGLLSTADSVIITEASALIAANEGELWKSLNVTSISPFYVQMQWSGWKAGQLRGNQDVGIEIQYKRLRDGVELPEWCNGTLLYEMRADSAGRYTCRVNTDKATITDQTQITLISDTVFDILEQAGILAMTLDQQIGWA